MAGAALQSYGQSQVAGAQKRDITASGQQYEQERARQQAFTKEGAGSVASTLQTYSPQAVQQRTADAVGSRQTAYTAPLQAKNFVADMPADFDPNNVVAARNAFTGNRQQGKSISEALAKAKLDAYGDVKTGGDLAANDNANTLAMVRRIAAGSNAAAGIQQGTLQSKLEADKGAGSFAGGLGDLFTAAGSLYGMSGGGAGSSLFGSKIPVVGPQLPGGTPATYGRSIFGMQF
jgi:hypothetical protein